MAPQGTGHTIDRTPEYNDFMTRLKAYTTARGTNLEPEPRVGAYHLDLYKTFNHIVAAGGYDKVSNEKLAWRRMSEELGLAQQGDHNIASVAFSLKEKFYKNLAAFEIKFVHGKEPPPKDILEDVTAKGGDLLTRTRDNFRLRRDSGIGAASAAASGDDATPNRDRQGDTPGSSSRASRGLREAPPQRVLFQPETGPTRTHRQSSGPHVSHPSTPASGSHATTPAQSHLPQGTPTPAVHQQPRQPPRGAAVTYAPPNGENIPAAALNYEPKPMPPIALRPVDTPSSNPAEFARRRQRPLAELAGRAPMQPGTGFDGPNIYMRCLNALRSRIPSEQAFALHHLVKISFERGDKFKFDSFHGLAEGLVEKVLEVGSLFYHVNWAVSWDMNLYQPAVEVLDGNNGTPDISDRIAALERKLVLENLQPAQFDDAIGQIAEAASTIRNMVQLGDNAVYLADYYPARDMICIVLRLPEDHPSVVELKHSCLDIAEQLMPNMELESSEPLYQCLLAELETKDRGRILTALRGLSRISVNLDAANKLGNVPARVLESICNWLLLNDEDMKDACLDFLYQYTAVVGNVNTLVQSIVPENLVGHLVRLLSHGAKKRSEEKILEQEQTLKCRDDVASMPKELARDLLKLEEPERVYQWIKCFFEEDKDSLITQIAAWQGYQNAFNAPLKQLGQGLISPADFIRNSTAVFKDSVAKVLPDPHDGQQKFVIWGVRSRVRPVGLDGKEFLPCLWDSETRPGQKCRQFFSGVESMWEHIMKVHIKAPTREGGRPPYDNVKGRFTCQWADCAKFNAQPAMVLKELAHHITTHCYAVAQESEAKRPRRDWIKPAVTMTVTYEETQTIRDDKNPNAPPQAAGVPLSAVLVLRNIARNVVKTESEEALLKQHELGGEGGGWNERLFRLYLPRLQEVIAKNQALAPHVASLLALLDL